MEYQQDERFEPETVLLRRVAVKFVDDFDIPYEDGAEDSFPKDLRGYWDSLSDQYPGITLKRVYTSVSPERIQELVKEAQERDPTYEAPNFLTFFAIDTASLEDAMQIAASFSGWDGVVEYAYVQPLVRLPSLNSSQRYIDAPASFGVNAINVSGWTDPENSAWASGEGIRFVDIEMGWNLSHPSLQTGGSPKLSPLPGLTNNVNLSRDTTLLSNQFRNGQHGTSVLGILAANENTGAPPNWKGLGERAEGYVVSIYWNSSGGLVQNIEDAILKAYDFLEAGDVLLLELETEVRGFGSSDVLGDRPKLWPVECLADLFLPIRQATALGITVVEAAGNSRQDFDDPNNSPFMVDPASNPGKYNPNPNYNQDSGAIIVGSAAVLTHGSSIKGRRSPASNYGLRVNCFAWDEVVFTTEIDASTGADTDAAGNPRYTTNFSGTSAASAIIAGAAIVLQAAAKHNDPNGEPLSTTEVRDLLSDPTKGTLTVNATPSNPNPDKIGVMPDLRAIIASL